MEAGPFCQSIRYIPLFFVLINIPLVTDCCEHEITLLFFIIIQAVGEGLGSCSQPEVNTQFPFKRV
ncbi:hypothetical protein LEP1GSC058_0875 [Leptospira fainei serovar Hurstbridge str. BUT 6]|uniref:Uncharacterized protein n=1 Tax=Leptospira fainei serovar Hurstbridge str. BUT 6 TaxID=1193011 RepID=S3UQL2_9LEPT|nr:hypothetical protein LEP1GSC058_0875 [Leptospira fainei serovar Hurstbridge str. BUT 6]